MILQKGKMEESVSSADDSMENEEVMKISIHLVITL